MITYKVHTDFDFVRINNDLIHMLIHLQTAVLHKKSLFCTENFTEKSLGGCGLCIIVVYITQFAPSPSKKNAEKEQLFVQFLRFFVFNSVFKGNKH